MYLFFDTETTGLPRSWQAPVSDVDNWPRLVQLAWLKYDDQGNEILNKNYIIKPEGFTIPWQAAKVHGISTERAKKEGVNLEEALEEFNKFLGESLFLIAHNMNFDEKIIGAELIRKNIDTSLFDIPKICTMKSSTNFCKIPGNYGDYKFPKLSELHIKLFQEDFQDAHNAAVDVRACAKCFFELKRKGIIKL